jgi:hypothetical protein
MRAEVWVRTDTKIIRADNIRAVGWSPPVAGVLLEVATSGEKQPLTIRVQPDQPDLPYHLRYSADTEITNKLCEEIWERGAGLDQGLLRAVTKAATVPGGAVVYLDHDDEGYPKQWEIEPLASGAPAPE